MDSAAENAVNTCKWRAELQDDEYDDTVVGVGYCGP